MVLLWLFAIALLLFALQYREFYEDPESPVTPPTLDRDGRIPSVWQSKIDAEAPIGGNDMDYFRIIQNFYTQVYVPSGTKPKDTDIETFVKSTSAVGVDEGAIRKILAAAFRVEKTIPSAAREEAQVRFQPTVALQPKDGIDEVFVRKEEGYNPADSRKGDLPEGLYEPTPQTEPNRPGDFSENSTSWSGAKFYSVCQGEACNENVL